MKLTVFGNNATCPAADGACASYLLEAAGKRILLDMGNGSLAKIQQRIDLGTLDAIIISHLHFDHFGDLFCAKYQLETRKCYGETIAAIPLVAPALPQWAVQQLLDNDVFVYTAITPSVTFSLGEIVVEFVALKHSIESYGIRISVEGKIFAYSGDTGRCDGIETLACGADMFLCEATFLHGTQEEGHHLSAASAAEIADKSGVQRLLLTHFHPSESNELFSQSQKSFEHSQLSEILGEYSI